MREVKFRYYDAANDVMIYDSEEGAEFTIKHGKVKVRYQREKNIVRDGIEMDVPVWIDAEGDGMEFTGLKDKNGKEIYEGDVLNVFSFGKLYRTVYVEYDQTLAMYIVRLCNNDDNFIDFKYLGHLFSFERETEVIGNIYENPELLK